MLMIASDVLPQDALSSIEPDFEDDRTNDTALSSELDDIFGSVVSGRNLEDISDDEWGALK